MSDTPFGKPVRVITWDGVMEGKLSGFSHEHLLVKVGDRIRMVPYEEVLAADLVVDAEATERQTKGRRPW